MAAVTQDECKERRRACKVSMKPLWGLVTVGIALVALTLSVSWMAHTEANEAKTSTGEHKAAAEERAKATDDKLDSIQQDVRDGRVSQDRLNERLTEYFTRGGG